MATVQDVLAQPDLGLTAVVLPHPEADLRWVATSELADPAPFLEGGELLLTTGLGTKGWRTTQWTEYVARLVEAGVVALGLGIELTHRRPPVALVRACENQGLNLIVVPKSTAFVSVSRSAARLVEHTEEAQARAALAMQRDLTAAASRPDPVPAIVARLARLVDGEACLLDPDGHVLTGSISRDVTDELARIRTHGLRGASTTGDTTGAFLLLPVGLRGRPSSYLAAAIPGRPSDGQRNAVTTAIALLSFVAEQDHRQREVRRTLTARALELLVNGATASAEIVADAASLGVLPEHLQLLRANGTATALSAGLERAEATGLTAAIVAGELVAVVVGRLPDLDDLRVGVGSRTARKDAADSYRTAGLALARTTASAAVVQWDQVVREGTIALVDPDLASAFAASFLDGLDPDLVETLRAFLRHHGSRLQVATELGVHRNTVRNRIEQIEAVIGRSLEDPDTRASAWLALQA